MQDTIEDLLGNDELWQGKSDRVIDEDMLADTALEDLMPRHAQSLFWLRRNGNLADMAGLDAILQKLRPGTTFVL